MQLYSNQREFLFKKLSQIIDFNQDFESRGVVISSILRDLNALYEESQKGLGWRNLFIDELATLNVTNETILRFHHKVINFTTFEIKKLIVAPSVKLSAERIKYLFAIRGLIILWHLEHDRKISSTLLGQLDVLFKAKSFDTLSLINNLSVDLQHLVNLNVQYPPTHKWFKFISALIDSLQSVEVGPIINQKLSNSTFSIEHHLIDGRAALLDGATEDVSNNKKIYTPIHASGDLFRYHYAGLNRLFRKDFSGIPNLYKHYHPDELLQFIPSIVKGYLIDHDDVSLAFLLCLILRCHVSRFHLISLYPSAGSNIWLDLDHGYLVWNRLALIKKSEEVEKVNIPLPVEIIKSLIGKFQISSHSKTLGDLFGEDLPYLKKKVREFTFTNSLSSHRAFVTRLYFSYGRFILKICRDEVYAAAIAVDFSLGVTANFNYVVLEPARINEICELTYKKLGFSGEFLNPVIRNVGSKQGQEVEKIVNLLNEALHSVNTSFAEINNRTSLEQLILVHNQISFSLALLMAITCGFRKAVQYSVCNHTLDLKNGLMLVSDKASTEYLSSRLVPIPEITQKWLYFYKNWLKSFALRLSTKNKQISADVASVCDEECGFGSIPLLFYFHRRVIKPVGSKHIYLFVKKEGLESNLGRHFLDRILRNSIGSALLNTHAGRANLGQESFGMRSALAVTDAMHMLKLALDSQLNHFNISLPPQKTSTRYTKPNSIKPYHPFSWNKTTQKKQLGEACPYSELTLLNARIFEKLIAIWVTTELRKDIGQFAISLILMDGIIHEEEVLFSIQQVLQGRILKIDDDYFIDVDTPSLGIRRINLSNISMCVLNSVSLPEGLIDEAEIKIQIENAISQLFTGVGLIAKNPLNRLAELAENFYSIRVSGTLREWMSGRQHARTLRPETFLRHKLQLKERLSELSTVKHQKGKLRSNQAIVNALNEACDKENNKDSNQLRMKKIASVLEGMIGTFFALSDNVLAQFAWFLCAKCPKIKAPSSVRTHFYVINKLVQSICIDLDDPEELKGIDWLEISTNFLADSSDERKIYSLNYLLRLFNQPEIKSLKKDEARASRTYIDYPSLAEIRLAIKRINENAQLSEYQKLSALMLSLIAHLPLRAEDIASLRLCDIFIGENSFIVITSSSTGSRKSDNANRVLFLTDPDLIHQLKVLKKIRTSLSSAKVPTTSLFGSSVQLRSFEGTEELLSIVADALRSATGSNFVRPHCLRSKYLSENFKDALMPQNAIVDALRQRNIVYELSVTAGHADPGVSIKNYVCDFNLIRRCWVDKLILDELKPSAHFLASITSCAYEAWRKRLQRNFSITDLKREFQAEVNAQLNLRIFDLVQSLHMDNFEYALSAEKESIVLEVQFAQFLACLLLGMENDAAAAYVNMANLVRKDIEFNLNIFGAHKGAGFFTKLRTEYERFKICEVFINLAQHFGFWTIDPAQSAQLLRLIPCQLDEPLSATINDISFILDFVCPSIQRAGFNLTVLIPDINLQENQKKVAQLYRLGVRRVEECSRRNFKARDQLKILFRKTGISHQSNMDQKINNFEINIFMLSFLITHKI